MVIWLGNKVSDQSRQINYRLDGFFKELHQLHSDIESSAHTASVPKAEIKLVAEEKVPQPVITPQKTIIPEVHEQPIPDPAPKADLLQVETSFSTFDEDLLREQPDFQRT